MFGFMQAKWRAGLKLRASPGHALAPTSTWLLREYPLQEVNWTIYNMSIPVRQRQ